MYWLVESVPSGTVKNFYYELDQPRIHQILIAFTVNADDFQVRLFPSGSPPWPANGPLIYPGGYLMTFDVDLTLDRERHLLTVCTNNTAAAARSFYLGLVTDAQERIEYQIADALREVNDNVRGLRNLLAALKATVTRSEV